MASAGSSERHRFGPFELQPGERRLLARGEAVHLRPRALDLLIALVEQSGHPITKDELFLQVWGTLIVEENALQAHISALRKVLGAEAIATVTGQGYRFALPVTSLPQQTATAPRPQHNLPRPLTSFIGRESEIAQVKQWLTCTRLLTLAGAGGCGRPGWRCKWRTRCGRVSGWRLVRRFGPIGRLDTYRPGRGERVGVRDPGADL